MRMRVCVVLALVVGLVFALAWGAAAQGPDPARRDQRGPGSAPGAPDGPFAPSAPGAATVALGQPGLSPRYVQTFGQTGVFFVSDTTHFNLPFGVGTDGTSVWIADTFGLRAAKFNGQTGAFLSEIGSPGYRYATGQNIDFVADVTVDASGNVWLVDSDFNDVLEFSPGGTFLLQLGTRAASGSDNSHFNSPSSVAFDSAGNVYVGDNANHRVQVFGAGGGYSTTIGLSGVPTSTNAGFNSTRHIALDGSDRLYVADVNNQRVQIFDVSNPLAPAYVATLGVSGAAGSDNAHLSGPRGVGVDASKIYVADSGNNRVQVFDRSSLAFLQTIGSGTAGSGSNQFNFPSDVAINSAGSVFVADQSNDRVQQFDSSFAYVRTYGTTGVPYATDNNHFNQPRGVAVASDGSIYVAEYRGYRLLKLDAAGVPQWTVGEAGVRGSDNLHFNAPGDVALDAASLIYVADSSNNRVQIFKPDGTYSTTFGSFGSGPYQFNFPTGLFIAPDNTLYVADSGNQRVQIYDAGRHYLATVGITGTRGSDNAHLSSPYDVAVDGHGTMYISDPGNVRVQVYDAARNYVRTLGVTGASADDFSHFNSPANLAVDSHNNLYVASTGNKKVYVFDASGAFLTIMGGFGGQSGQLRNGYGLAFDQASNLYIADSDNARIQKLAFGVPGWLQTNINGFGSRANFQVRAMTVFSGQLFAGTATSGSGGAQLWRSAGGTNWTPVLTNGFGITTNVGIDFLTTFNNRLYAGTIGGAVFGFASPAPAELWRSDDGVGWTRVISSPQFGAPTTAEVESYAVYSNVLYISTASYASSRGSEIWRSSTGDSGDWTRVISGFGNALNADISLAVFQGILYGGTYNDATGAQLLRTSDGISWTPVMTDGFGNVNNSWLSALTEFGGYFYAGTRNLPQGAEVWRSADGTVWSPVLTGGAGNVHNARGYCLVPFNGKLYACFNNVSTGTEVWATTDGTAWQPVIRGGWGDSNNNFMTALSHSVTSFSGTLYMGTENDANGGEVWRMFGNNLYLPAVRR